MPARERYTFADFCIRRDLSRTRNFSIVIHFLNRRMTEINRSRLYRYSFAEGIYIRGNFNDFNIARAVFFFFQ